MATMASTARAAVQEIHARYRAQPARMETFTARYGTSPTAVDSEPTSSVSTAKMRAAPSSSKRRNGAAITRRHNWSQS